MGETSIKNPIPFAHRGNTAAAPENTAAAFDSAVALGCCVEMDIRRTADGELVVFHDPDLRRVALGTPAGEDTRPVEALRWQELQRIRLPYAGHLLQYFPPQGFEREEWYYYPWALDNPQTILARAAGQQNENPADAMTRLIESYRAEYMRAFDADPRTAPLMSLREFLRWVRRQPAWFCAEIEYKGLGLNDGVYTLLEETGTADRCILMSGVPAINTEMQAFAAKNGKPAGLRFGANIRYANEEQLASIREWDLYEVGLNAGTFDAQTVAGLMDIGIRVFSNLGDTPVWWQAMQRNGVAAFKTNCPQRYLEWLRQKQTE